MSLVGVDVGTTGCKVLVFSRDGKVLASSYAEYDIQRDPSGRAELDSRGVWELLQGCLRQALGRTPAGDPPLAICATSMGEAMVPVTRDGEILGPSLLNVDTRGNEYLPLLREAMSDQELYLRNGNTWGSQYGATKLKWFKDHEPDLYHRADWFLNWAHFVAFKLGAEAVVDYSLANRSLLFDIRTAGWSSELVDLFGLDIEKLPRPVAAGTEVGRVSRTAADLVGLPAGIPVIAGAHDQCVNALGCGAVTAGTALYGMGTFPTIAPVFEHPGPPELMTEIGLCTEHHAVTGLFTGFIFHMGGASVKWYRDIFASAEHIGARERGGDIYPELFAEIGAEPSGLLLLPYLTPMGPPDFIDDQSGALMGLTVQTTRAQVLRSIVEANAMALNLVVERLPDAGIPIHSMRVAGGGSRSDICVQINSDILGAPLERPDVTEAGALGAAILAGVGCGVYGSVDEAVAQLVRVDRVFEPDAGRHQRYRELFGFYKEARSGMADLLRRFTASRDRITGTSLD